MLGEEALHLFPTPTIRNEICADSHLSKRASVLMRYECDLFAADLLTRAFCERAAVDEEGPLEADDLWAAFLGDLTQSSLVDHLGASTAQASFPSLIRLPPPPAGVPPHESEPVQQVVWHRTRACGRSRPVHGLLLEPMPPCERIRAAEHVLGLKGRLHPALLA
jgi:hypothetical protein